MEGKVLSHVQTGVEPVSKGDGRKGRFWYDVRAVSGSHAEVTVSIAGLSLALLLVLPVFNPTVVWKEPRMAVSVLFFFISLVFGILASFEYSVLSGDMRSEMNRLITFMGPSAAFGVAVPALFLGFVYAVDMYLGAATTPMVWLVMRIMRWLTVLALWSAGVLVVRTAVEALQFLEGRWRGTAWYKGKIVLTLMLVYGVCGLFSIVRFYSRQGLSITLPKSQGYFYFMVALAFMSVFHYALFSYMGIEEEKGEGKEEQAERKENAISKFMLWLGSPESVKYSTMGLMVAFSVFVIWTFWAFV